MTQGILTELCLLRYQIARLVLCAAMAALASAQMPDTDYPEEGIGNATLASQAVTYSDSTGASLQVLSASSNLERQSA